MSYAPAPAYPDSLSILGLKINPVGVPEVHDYIRTVIEKNQKALVLNLNIHCVSIALKHPWLVRFLNSAQMIFCDGDGVRWGLKVMGDLAPPKIGVTRWLWELAEFSEKQGYSLFLLGAKPGVAEEAGDRLTKKFQKLKLAGVHHGYFKREGAENAAVIEQINRSKPDILVAAFGMPVQEKWFSENWEKTEAHIFVAGGAVLDYAAGRLGQVPAWMLCLRLEWLFRVWQEPRRLFWRYASEIPFFLAAVILDKIKRDLFGADSKHDHGKRFEANL